MTATTTATTEAPIRRETVPVRLAKTVEVELPVVHRSTGGQFVVVSNPAASTRAEAHPYFVVHIASGLRSPVPPSVGKHSFATARQLASYLELAGFFDVRTGKPTVTADGIRQALADWRP